MFDFNLGIYFSWGFDFLNKWKFGDGALVKQYQISYGNDTQERRLT